MADILGRMDQVYAGGLTSDASWMFWAGLQGGGLGMLITQMSIQYQQPIRRIFEIGPWVAAAAPFNGQSPVVGQPVYYVAGRPEGQLQLGRIAGPVAALGGFYKQYGNICTFLNSLLFVSSSGCIGTISRRDTYLGWYMNGVVIQSLGLAAQAQDMMVTENVQCQFVSLRLFTADPAANVLNKNNVGELVLNVAVWKEV